jgi:hypothetical protein
MNHEIADAFPAIFTGFQRIGRKDGKWANLVETIVPIGRLRLWLEPADWEGWSHAGLVGRTGS